MTSKETKSFPKSFRLTHKKDFEYLRERSKKCFVPPLVSYSKESRLSQNNSRLGLSVSKKQGGAVRRNRLKRILRDEFRHSPFVRHTKLDLLIVAANVVKNESEMRDSFRSLLERTLGNK